MAIDSEQTKTIRGGWGGRRTNRKTPPAAVRSILHAQIDAVNHDNLRKIANANEVSVGEMLDVLLFRVTKRLIAKGATGLTLPSEHV